MAQKLGLMACILAQRPQVQLEVSMNGAQGLHTIRAQAPDATECISYGVPTFDLAGQHLVHFAGYARHIGFYPTSRPFQVFAEALAPYKCGKGSVQFRHDQPLPLPLIAAIVQMRVTEVLAESKK